MILSLVMGMIKHSQSTQSSKFAISIQYLKKYVQDGVHFLHADKHQSWHYCYWWKWPDISKVSKIGSWQYFCYILRKKCCNCFCVLLWCKKIRCFMVVQSCLLLLVSVFFFCFCLFQFQCSAKLCSQVTCT